MKFNQELEQIKTYEAGKPIELVVREFGISPSEVIKLASNENPLGTSPKVVETIKQNAKNAYLYPDDSMYELKEALSKEFSVKSNNIIIGAGSDQVIEFISRAKLNPNASILITQVTFAMYEIYAKQMGAQVIKTKNFRHLANEFIPIIKEQNPDIVYICTPNNPTGDATKKEEVFKIIEATNSSNTLVVVDGAYMEYAQAKDNSYLITPKELLTYPNTIYLGTFSKAYGLGGMRVGYGISNSNIIEALYKMRPPFNITTLSLASAISALGDKEFIKRTLFLHLQELKRYEEYAKAKGFKYIDSYTNFITYLFDDNLNSSDIANALLRRGVIIRDLASYGLNAIRITVGTSEQNSKLFKALDEVLE